MIIAIAERVTTLGYKSRSQYCRGQCHSGHSCGCQTHTQYALKRVQFSFSVHIIRTAFMPMWLYWPYGLFDGPEGSPTVIGDNFYGHGIMWALRKDFSLWTFHLYTVSHVSFIRDSFRKKWFYKIKVGLWFVESYVWTQLFWQIYDRLKRVSYIATIE